MSINLEFRTAVCNLKSKCKILPSKDSTSVHCTTCVLQTSITMKSRIDSAKATTFTVYFTFIVLWGQYSGGSYSVGLPFFCIHKNLMLATVCTQNPSSASPSSASLLLLLLPYRLGTVSALLTPTDVATILLPFLVTSLFLS